MKALSFNRFNVLFSKLFNGVLDFMICFIIGFYVIKVFSIESLFSYFTYNFISFYNPLFGSFTPVLATFADMFNVTVLGALVFYFFQRLLIDNQK